MSSKDPNSYPKGWSRERVESVIAHYDAQSEDEAIAEAEAAYVNSSMKLIRVPIDLVPEVERLIAEHTSEGEGGKRKSA